MHFRIPQHSNLRFQTGYFMVTAHFNPAFRNLPQPNLGWRTFQAALPLHP
jgi:hypothetical protein